VVTVRIKGPRKPVRVIAGDRAPAPVVERTAHYARAVDAGRAPPRKGPVYTKGERIREVKQRQTPATKPEARIAILTRIAHERGPDFLRHEIAVHERKIAELRAALDAFTAEGGTT
jgi:hypothetical protein